MNDVSLVYIESLLSSMQDRQRLVEILFEQIGVGSLTLVNEEAMSLLASGQRDGVVVRIGHDLSSVVPIVDGLPLMNKISTAEVVLLILQ